jgi:membrane-bound metal-dependent hydrolase YbcI (DUF457 family)
MFIGHFAVGFALKRGAPETSLGWLIAAPIFLDMVWPIFVLTGIERVEIDPGNTAFTPLNFVSYPYSHSLGAAIVWSIVLAVVYFAIGGTRSKRGSVFIALGVFSHWILDVITHRADMPLYPGSRTFLGLGLWSSVPATLIVETLMFIAGVWLYASMTKAKDKIGAIAFWAYVLFLVVAYVASSFGPPPPSVTALGIVGLSGWIFPFWAGWFDRHRRITTA